MVVTGRMLSEEMGEEQMNRVNWNRWPWIGLVCLMTLFGANQAVGQDSKPKGAYVLVGIERDTADFEKSQIAKILSFSDTHAVLRASHSQNYKLCERVILYRWNIPPAVLQPGETFVFDLYIQNKLLRNEWDAHIGEVTAVRIDTDIGGPLWTNDRAGKPVAIGGQVNHTYPASKVVHELVDWKIPNPRQFKTLRISYGFAANTGGRVIYDYQWQDNPQPKDLEVNKPKSGEDSLDPYVTNPDQNAVPGSGKGSGGGASEGPNGGGGGKGGSVPPVPAGFTVRIGKVKVKAGETVTIPIEVFKPTDVSSLNVEIGYSSSVASVKEKPEAGDLKGNRLFEANSGESGVVLVGLAGSAPLSSDGQLAIVKFTAVGKPGEKSPLTVKVTSANLSNGNPVSAATIDGELEIAGESKGDINGDDIVDPRDALDALKMSVRLLPVNLVADMDGNGIITANDARMILLKAVGK